MSGKNTNSKKVKTSMPELENDSRAGKLIIDMNKASMEIARREWEFAKKLQTLHNLLALEKNSPFACNEKYCPIKKMIECVGELVTSYNEVLDGRDELKTSKESFLDLVIETDDEEDDDEEASNKKENQPSLKRGKS